MGVHAVILAVEMDEAMRAYTVADASAMCRVRPETLMAKAIAAHDASETGTVTTAARLRAWTSTTGSNGNAPRRGHEGGAGTGWGQPREATRQCAPSTKPNGGTAKIGPQPLR